MRICGPGKQGDRWQSALDHLKSHDLQYWQPLAFNDAVSPPTIAPLSFVDNFTLTGVQ